MHVGRAPEALVRAVPALVRAEVDVAVGVRPADHLLGGADVVGVGRPDEPVGAIARAASAALNSATFSSTNSRVGRPSSTAAWAMLIECSSVPVRNRVSSPSIRCQRAIASAADHLVQRVQARLVVGVRDRGGQVEARTVGHGSADGSSGDRRSSVPGRPGAPIATYPATVGPWSVLGQRHPVPSPIVGAGYVGLVSAVGLARLGHTIELVETDPSRLVELRDGRVPFTRAGRPGGVQLCARVGCPDGSSTAPPDATSEIVVICVGTPIDDRGHADMSAVESVLAEIGGA